ncbi:MAG TPA: 2-dehydropantoate 2-reductase N-terminal domain-containing protein [Devosiaceae bacterium]|nr:2-dehydropantoate 2-reductase N-terminal domain-containing protein [Devosiaceae bacterium]
MKFVIYGVGAIGGVLAAKLALSGAETVGIARGPQLEAIRKNGLLLRTPQGEETVRFETATDPEELKFADDDVIILAMKTQDTPLALQRLRAAGVVGQPIVCAQNGVTNERFALRRFPNVYAMTVMLPASYVRPGEVNAFGAPHAGILDLGRYPIGADTAAASIVAALTKAGFASEVDANAMQGKYGKLMQNLGNIVDAALQPGDHAEILEAARNEAVAVYKAAGIAWRDVGLADPRRQALLQMQPIPGVEHVGSSTTQSLARHTGSIETDYLNGEIVLLGRLNDVPTPVNVYFSGLAQRMIGEKLKPRSISPSEVQRELAVATAAEPGA